MINSKLILALSAVAGLCAGANQAFASDAEIAALREQLQLLSQRLDELENSNSEQQRQLVVQWLWKCKLMSRDSFLMIIEFIDMDTDVTLYILK